MSTSTSATVLPVPKSSWNFSLLQLLLWENLIGLNYLDWIFFIRVTLRYNNKVYVLYEVISMEPKKDATR